jgi:peptide deformylase
MSAVEIVQLGNPVLRVVATPVTEVGGIETQTEIKAMQAALASTQGVGLAAPQIGISKQIVIVASRPSPRYPQAPLMEPTVMINPRFVALSEEKEKGWEGCLSIPGIRALVPRYTAIEVTYTNIEGHAVQQQFDSFVARIFQHEYDHLEGKVYLDRVEDNQDIVAESEYFKLIV